jgi:hypothetical protein
MAVCKNVLVVFCVIATINLCLAKPKWIWQRDEVTDDLDVERRPYLQRDVEMDGIQDEMLRRQQKRRTTTKPKPCTLPDYRMCGKYRPRRVMP